MNLASRAKIAWNLVFKGSMFPFDRIPVIGGGAGEKLTRPYAKSVWVQRAIKKVAGPVAAVPLGFVNPTEQKQITDSRLDAFWKNPAKGLTRHDFVEGSIGWLKLKGECFWVLDDTALVPFPEVKTKFSPMILARPDRMRPILENFNDSEAIGWEYTDARGRRHALLPEQVIHLKFWNPDDEIRGLAEFEAAEIATEADYLAGAFNRNLMRNNGDTGPIIAAKNGVPTDEQQRQIISQLRMKREYAQRGEFRPVFLSNDITVEDAKVKTPDADFVNIRLQNRHEIFSAFGVPPSMADKMESYSVGSASDWYLLINETCIPTGQKLCGGIDLVNQRVFGIETESFFDFDEHPVMQAVRRERLEAAEKLWTKGMPMSAINDYLALGLKPFEGWNVGYLPFSVSPVGALEMTPAEDPANDPALAEDPGAADKAIAQMKSALNPISQMKQLLCNHGGSGDDGVHGKRSAKEIALWKSHMAKRRVTIKSYESAFNRELFKARSSVLAKLEKAEKTLGARVTQKAAAADFLFDLVDFKKGLLASMRKVGKAGLQEAGKQLLAELAKDDPFTMPDSKVISFLQRRENKLADTADDIYGQIKSELQIGIEEGETMKELSDRVRASFNGISKERATRVAMTETAAIYGEGRQAAMEQAGVQYKQWLTSGNDNVRPAHAEANGQIVPVDEDFTVGGESLSHPGDERGSAENVINCHCVSIATTLPEDGE